MYLVESCAYLIVEHFHLMVSIAPYFLGKIVDKLVGVGFEAYEHLLANQVCSVVLKLGYRYVEFRTQKSRTPN